MLFELEVQALLQSNVHDSMDNVSDHGLSTPIYYTLFEQNNRLYSVILLRVSSVFHVENLPL